MVLITIKNFQFKLTLILRNLYYLARLEKIFKIRKTHLFLIICIIQYRRNYSILNIYFHNISKYQILVGNILHYQRSKIQVYIRIYIYIINRKYLLYLNKNTYMKFRKEEKCNC